MSKETTKKKKVEEEKEKVEEKEKRKIVDKNWAHGYIQGSIDGSFKNITNAAGISKLMCTPTLYYGNILNFYNKAHPDEKCDDIKEFISDEYTYQDFEFYLHSEFITFCVVVAKYQYEFDIVSLSIKLECLRIFSMLILYKLYMLDRLPEDIAPIFKKALEFIIVEEKRFDGWRYTDEATNVVFDKVCYCHNFEKKFGELIGDPNYRDKLSARSIELLGYMDDEPIEAGDPTLEEQFGWARKHMDVLFNHYNSLRWIETVDQLPKIDGKKVPEGFKDLIKVIELLFGKWEEIKKDVCERFPDLEQHIKNLKLIFVNSAGLVHAKYKHYDQLCDTRTFSEIIEKFPVQADGLHMSVSNTYYGDMGNEVYINIDSLNVHWLNYTNFDPEEIAKRYSVVLRHEMGHAIVYCYDRRKYSQVKIALRGEEDSNARQKGYDWYNSLDEKDQPDWEEWYNQLPEEKEANEMMGIKYTDFHWAYNTNLQYEDKSEPEK